MGWLLLGDSVAWRDRGSDGRGRERGICAKDSSRCGNEVDSAGSKATSAGSRNSVVKPGRLTSNLRRGIRKGRILPQSRRCFATKHNCGNPLYIRNNGRAARRGADSWEFFGESGAY